MPYSHEAIAAFGDEPDLTWIVSVKMVSGGVDIPRLGVVVWASTATTELMVRQVAGRALRARPDLPEVPAVMHLPADPDLERYALGIEVVEGLRPTKRKDGECASSHSGGTLERTTRMISTGPFASWVEKWLQYVPIEEIIDRCGLGDYDDAERKLFRWRQPGSITHVLNIYDACYMAGIDFAELYCGDEYADARAFVEDPDFGKGRLRCRAVEAHTDTENGPRTFAPALPTARLRVTEREVSVAVPSLPPSPEDLRREAEERKVARAELFRTLGVYHQLKRMVEPACQLATVHREMAR